MPQPLQVLIVEDSPIDAKLMLAELRNAGFEPVARIVESEADYVKCLGPDLEVILSDFTMPRFDGFRALEILEESGFDIPFILISGTIGEDVAVEAMKHGASDYLLKDRLTRLGPAVRLALEQRRTLKERRQMEQALRESELRYRSLFENMLEGYAYCRMVTAPGRPPDFRYLAVNGAFETLSGLRNVVGRNISDVVSGIQETNPELFEIYGRVSSTGRPEKHEMHIAQMAMWFAVSVYSHEPGHFAIVFDNITERKLAEMETRFNEERFRSLVEATTAIVWNTPASGEFQSPQPGWTAFTGQTFEELQGWGWLNAVHPDDRQETELVWSAAFTNRTIYKVEHRLRRSDRTYRDMMVRAVPILAENGTIRQWVGIHTDVTEERLREKKLAEALGQEKELSEKARSGDHAKSEFLAVMSHEIRTPLNGILGFSELLALTPNLPAESRDYIQTITASGEALLRILNDVLEFSRLEAGNVQVEKVFFSPSEVLGDIRTLLARQAGEKKLAFNISIGEDIPKSLESDVGRLRQILLNLAGNAIKFTEHGSVTLGIRAATTAGHYEFSVTDTGDGLTDEQIRNLFQPFTQADSSISRRHGGTGLGLSISRHLAELLGGTLIVRSQPGQGSEFILTMNLEAAEPLATHAKGRLPQTPDAGFAGLHPLRILVVDDDKVNLKLILALVRRLGYQPLSAKNGLEAVEVQQRERPDCVLMDMQMPEMDGIEATEKIRSLEKLHPLAKPVFISALTANIFPADRQRCLDAGMNFYLNKPVKLTALAEMFIEAGDFVASHAQA